MAYTCKSLSCVGFTASGSLAALPLYCRKWSCETCGKFQRKRLRRRLIAGEPNCFITLTVNPRLHQDKDTAFRAASLAVNRLMKVLRRRYPHKRIEYALIWERTKKGWPHAHLLLRAPWIHQKLLSRQWERLSGAKIVDVRMVRSNGEAVAYVSKYLTKDPAVPTGYRRYRTSRAYSNPEPQGQLSAILGIDGWHLAHAPLPSVIANLEAHGYQLYEWKPELWVSTPSATADPPPIRLPGVV